MTVNKKQENNFLMKFFLIKNLNFLKNNMKEILKIEELKTKDYNMRKKISGLKS